jgi:hypothetical protein
MLEAKGKFWGEEFGRTWNPRRDGTRSVRPIVNCGIMKTEMADANNVRYGPITDIAQIPACLIADVNMPAMTGIELYRCLHAVLTGRRAK